MNKITITRPDDWHLHLRDGDALKAVLPDTVRRFARASTHVCLGWNGCWRAAFCRRGMQLGVRCFARAAAQVGMPRFASASSVVVHLERWREAEGETAGSCWLPTGAAVGCPPELHLDPHASLYLLPGIPCSGARAGCGAAAHSHHPAGHALQCGDRQGQHCGQFQRQRQHQRRRHLGWWQQQHR